MVGDSDHFLDLCRLFFSFSFFFVSPTLDCTILKIVAKKKYCLKMLLYLRFFPCYFIFLLFLSVFIPFIFFAFVWFRHKILLDVLLTAIFQPAQINFQWHVVCTGTHLFTSSHSLPKFSLSMHLEVTLWLLLIMSLSKPFLFSDILLQAEH